MKIAKIFAIGLAALTVFASCSNEPEMNNQTATANGKGMLAVQMPGRQAVTTYATFDDNASENEISIGDMRVYLFDASNTLVYTVKYKEFDSGTSVARFPLNPADPDAEEQQGDITSNIGNNVTAVFVANYVVPTAQYTVGTTTLSDFRELVTPEIVATADIKPFIMYGEAAAVTIEDYTATTTFASVIMTRLASRIDITNEIGTDIEIVSAQVLSAATSSYLALPSPAAQPAAYADLDVVTNLGLGADGMAGTGAGSDDMDKMWAQVYTYPNTNDTDPTTVVVTYKYKGVQATKTIVFEDAAGTVIPVERNYRYNVVFTQETLDMPEIPVTSVAPWNDGDFDNMEGNITNAALSFVTPNVDGTNIISYTPNATASTGGVMVVAGFAHTFDIAYTATSAVSANLTADNDSTKDSPWVAASNTEINTYAAAGAFTGKVTVSVERNVELDGREAIVKIVSGDRTATILVKQNFDNTPIPAVNVDSDANMFIVAPSGSPIVFDMAQVVAEGKNRIQAGDKVGVKFLWTDLPAGMSATGAVKSVLSYYTGTDMIVEVTPGSASGNVVVAAYNFTTQKIAWSWHIWVTDYDPSTSNYTYTSTGTKSATAPDAGAAHTFMDRNLGAMNSTPGDVMSQGLMYQFGRKDPFIGKNAWIQSTAETPIYDANGVAFNVTKIQAQNTPNAGNPNTLDYAFENPTAFIWGGEDFDQIHRDWYTTINDRAAQNHYLWATIDGSNNVSKTVYDPCPKGWRVPANGAHAGLVQTAGNAYAFPWSPLAYGRFGTAASPLPTDGVNNITANDATDAGTSATVGYYPASGNRYSGSGNFLNVGTYGYYWSSTAVLTNGSGYNLPAYATGLTTSNNSPRASGFPVRCVQE